MTKIHHFSTAWKGAVYYGTFCFGSGHSLVILSAFSAGETVYGKELSLLAASLSHQLAAPLAA